MTKTELIQSLIKQAQEIPYRDKESLNVFLEQADSVLKSFYGNIANYRADLKMIRFSPWSFQSSENEFKTSWNSGRNALINLLNDILTDPTVIVPPAESTQRDFIIPKETDDLAKVQPAQKPVTPIRKLREIAKKRHRRKRQKEALPSEKKEKQSLLARLKTFIKTEKNTGSEIKSGQLPEKVEGENKIETTVESKPPAPSTPPVPPQRIFLVHGIETNLKNSVLEVLRQLGLEPVLTREKQNLQKTMMQKFTEYTDVNCAVVILSADDLAYKNSEKPKDAKFRAYQDVVFEMGMFIGKFGRNRVFVLHPDKANFELPALYFDAIYISFDKEGQWKMELTEKLNHCGYQLNAGQFKK